MQTTFSSPLLRRAIVAVAVAVVVLGGGYVLSAPRTRAAQTTIQQPIAFNHQVMVQIGIQCLFCHTEARRSPTAGIPSVEKCMGCHQVIATDNSEIKKVAGYWARGEPIPWVRVNTLPRFVYFSHQVHVVAAGLNCEQCHGDVGHMAVDMPVVRMNMGWCLSCHEKQSNAAQLRDCLVCHQ